MITPKNGVRIPGTDIWVCKETISVARAQEIKEKNTHNRKLKKAWVRKLVRDMKAKAWKLTHQGIAFYKNGTLADGQNRIEAVIEYGEAQEFLVFYNLSTDVITAIDQNSPRDVLDALKLYDKIDITSQEKQGAIFAQRMTNNYHFSPNANEKRTFIKKHIDAIRFVSECFEGVKTKGFNTAAFRGLVIRAYYSADHNKLRRFVRVATFQESRSSGDEAAVRYMDFLRSNYVERKVKIAGSEQVQIFRVGQTALLKFLNGEPVKDRLKATEAMKFPLPEEGGNE